MKRKLHLSLYIYSLSVMLFFIGCYKSTNPPEIEAPQNITATVSQNWRFAGLSVENRAIMYTVLGQGEDCIFILASIHGDETAGTPLVQYLAQYLRENPTLLDGHKVILLPIANPDGVARNRRYNANSVDLNRNFETQNRIDRREYGFMPFSEPEARTISKLISQYTPNRIVSIHQPLSCIDYDGPGQEIAEFMAQYCSLPVNKLGARPGSLGSYAGIKMGIPIITFEMQDQDSYLGTEMLWQKYGNALLAAIVYPDSLPLNTTN